jgi:hypothetical protein
LQFFAQAGFPCPALRNPSDHFLRCINSDFDKVKATLKGSMKLRVWTSSFALNYKLSSSYKYYYNQVITALSLQCTHSVLMCASMIHAILVVVLKSGGSASKQCSHVGTGAGYRCGMGIKGAGW